MFIGLRETRKACDRVGCWLALGGGLLLSGTFPETGSAADALCRRDEIILFSCRIGRATASVCASDGQMVQYRFGRLGKPQLVLPASRGDWRRSVTSGTTTLLGGGGAFAAFENRGFRYVVYTGISHGRAKAGVALESHGRIIRDVKCTSPAASELGPDLFSQYHFPEDKSGFTIP